MTETPAHATPKATAANKFFNLLKLTDGDLVSGMVGALISPQTADPTEFTLELFIRFAIGLIEPNEPLSRWSKNRRDVRLRFELLDGLGFASFSPAQRRLAH
ncbi:MAG: hypothetical protein L0Z50_18995 [Verrucomicrobiales bacterium]|nr:hypothetical protein [Verrucomicrobiales bacterium]